MTELLGRDELERRLARTLGSTFRGQLENLLDILGDPPDPSKLDESFWSGAALLLAGAIMPVLQDVFLQQALALIDETGIGVDWGLINVAAADWARGYAFSLVGGINDTTRRGLQGAISDYYTQGWTMGDLEDRLGRFYGPVRAEMIAVTEVTRASVQGELATAAEIQKMNPSIHLEPLWATNRDDLVCDLCSPLNGQPSARWIGDYPEGPPAHVRCLPGDTLVLPIGKVAAGSKRWYEGNIVIIETFENQLAATANHPVLTPAGWVAAGQLKQGDHVLSYDSANGITSLLGGDNQYGISRVQDIFSSLDFPDFRVPVSPPDFHNDGSGSDVAIIRADRKIMNYGQSDFVQPFAEQNLLTTNIVGQAALKGFGAPATLVPTDYPSTTSIMGRLNLQPSLFERHSLPLDSFGLRLIAWHYARLQNALPKSAAVDARFLGKPVLGFAGDISAQKIIKVGNRNFAGHVYNLQTESGIYIANGIITHNCRCWLNHDVTVVVR